MDDINPNGQAKRVVDTALPAAEASTEDVIDALGGVVMALAQGLAPDERDAFARRLEACGVRAGLDGRLGAMAVLLQLHAAASMVRRC